jgi:hypothetical protein
LESAEAGNDFDMLGEVYPAMPAEPFPLAAVALEHFRLGWI